MKTRKQPVIRIYIGKTEDLTQDIKEGKRRPSVCARRLLAYGIAENGIEEILPKPCMAGQIYELLEKHLGRGIHGKPYFSEFPKLHFNISHSGAYAVCAVSSVPCGIDIQEVRRIKTERLLERTMSLEEQKAICQAKDRDREFCRQWAKKESFLKLSGEGISRSLQDISEPGWYEMFQIQGDMAGCISADVECTLLFREVSEGEFFRMFPVR